MSVDIAALAEAVLGGDRAALARAITLVESSLPTDRVQATELMKLAIGPTSDVLRVGITGAPGSGKSTFIETLGLDLVSRGHRVAVLAIDPSSVRGGGSILGDKTRMERLSNSPSAFVRPSPSAGTLGGVARATREAMLLVEAAGFDIILVETVGVGQSEVNVAEMVDFVLVLMLPSGGDELQGIKRGLLELADLVAVNKVDLDREQAEKTAQDFASALHMIRPDSQSWSPPVLQCSALSGAGVREIWAKVESYSETMTANGERDRKRREQRVRWMWALVEDRLIDSFRSDVTDRLVEVEQAVQAGMTAPTAAAEELLLMFFGKR
ncbi:MAG: methylmalonyl Co-A mutase-associated GTPase MeaB [Acidimicrobiales bacterium]